MRARVRFAVMLIAWIASAGAPAVASEAGAQELIATVRANGVNQGEFTLLQTADGDYWIAAEDLPKLRVRPPDAARRQAPTGSYYSLRALSGNTLRFDEATLSVALDFPPEELEVTRLNVSGRRPRPEVTAPATSTILNYRAGVRQADHAAMQLRMTAELNHRVGEVLFRQEAKIETGRGLPAFARGVTQLIWDDRLNGRRVLGGDQLAAGGPFGTVFPAAGLSLTKLYAMTPEVLYHPTAAFQVTAATPAQVEVAVDGNPVYRTTVAPGPVAVQNLHYYSGMRNVRVTVIEASGQRQVYEQPFLFTEAALAKGMHEYSYFAGRRAELSFDDRWHYRESAWQGFHRYGASDWLTIEAGGEGSDDFASGGAGLLLRSDTMGLLSLGALGSTDRSEDRSARGWSARYTYITPGGTFHASRRRLDPGFRTFASAGSSLALLDETRVGGALRLSDAASLSMDYTRARETLATRRDYAIRLASALNRSTTVYAEYTRSQHSGAGDSWGLAVYLRLELERQQWAASNFRANPGYRGVEAEVGRQLPQGEGVGYRVGTILGRTNGEPSEFAHGSATWNLRPVSVDLNASAQTRGGSAHYAEASLYGAVVSLDGYVGATRQVADGFALARLGVPQPGVEVYLNNQAQGKTDADGNLLIPNVGAFGTQAVRLNDKQLSMEYSVARKSVPIAPAWRSGTLVTFGGRKLRAVTGQASRVEGAVRTPIASEVWDLTGPNGRLRIETAPSGDFYLDDGPPGRYTGTVTIKGKPYSCVMNIPGFSEAVHELQDALLCE